jgi:hypothetical protein
MRLITAITLIFLPGTFVATFFSTSFWDFAPGNRGSKVSSWVWLYWLVTISLTLLVLGVWRKFGALRQLVGSVVRFWRRMPLVRKAGREKIQSDEEVGKKGD